MTRRLLLLAVLACAATSAHAQVLSPRPWAPPKGVTLPDTLKKGVSYVGGVPDTGQFIPDSTVLARVDDRIIRVSDFREGFFSSYIDFRPKIDSLGRHQFLNSMVNKEILGIAALRINRPLTFEDRAVMREHTQRVLSNIVFQRLVADSARPTEADLRRTHEQMGWELHVKRISFRDRAAAEKTLADLRAKKVTWKEAQTRSTAKGDGPEGDIGWVQRGVVEPFIGAELFDVAPGKMSDVLHDAQGYHIAFVIERRKVKPPAYEASRILLTNMVAPVKMTKRIEEIRAQVRPRIHWQLDDANVRWAAERLGETQMVRQNPFGQVVDLSGHLPEFAPGDTARVLARWDGGQLTLGSFMSLYGALPLTARQNINNELAFTHQAETFALEPFMADLARERGLDKDPLAIQMIERKREELLVEHLFSDSVLSQVRVTDADREKYYKDHYTQFHSYQHARYAVIHRWTRAGADSIVAALKAGGSAHEILKADSLRGDRTVGGIRDLRDDRTDSYQKLVFEEMRVGDIRRIGPYKDGDYEVVQVLSYDPGRQLELREVMGIVDESVRNIAAEKKLNALLDRERAKRQITVHQDRLAFVKMADPALD